MSSPQGTSLSGSAVEFTYDAGSLVRRDVPHCSWTRPAPAKAGASAVTGRGEGHHGSSSSMSPGMVEVWYSSGGYTRSPICLQAELSSGNPVVFEAGALIFNHR